MILAFSNFATSQNLFMKTTSYSIENCYVFSIKKVHFIKKTSPKWPVWHEICLFLKNFKWPFKKGERDAPPSWLPTVTTIGEAAVMVV